MAKIMTPNRIVNLSMADIRHPDGAPPDSVPPSGSPFAASQLGWLFLYGDDVDQDFQAAASWFRLGAARDDPAAQMGLGTLYEMGALGGVPDHAEALAWFTRAALQGDYGAMFAMARFYYWGWVVPRSKSTAAFWLMVAVASGNDEAQPARDAIMTELTGPELLKVERLARDWRPKAH